MKASLKKATLVIAILISTTLFFQNCGSDVKFNSTSIESIVNDESTPIVCDPIVAGGSITSCDQLTNGFVGEIFYFLNKSQSTSIPSVVYDKFDNQLAFPSALTSVNLFFLSGLKLDARLYLSKIETPTIKFSEGFKDSQNSFIQDAAGNPLFEAFAFRVMSYLKLPNNLPEGDYEFALLSDDGSLLEIDTNQDLALETIVENDNLHSTRFGCSSVKVSLKHSQLLPVQIKYYQGPRAHIALTLLARQLQPNQAAGEDPDCGLTSSSAFYGSDPNQNANYVPDLINSKFGELTRRGWFVPQSEMFVLKK